MKMYFLLYLMNLFILNKNVKIILIFKIIKPNYIQGITY